MQNKVPIVSQKVYILPLIINNSSSTESIVNENLQKFTRTNGSLKHNYLCII